MKIKKMFQQEFKIVNDFLLANCSSPTHWPDWNLVISKHYKTEFFYFVAYEDDVLVGICPAHRIKNGLLYNIISGQFEYIPNGGWIFINNHTPKKIVYPLGYNESFFLNGLPYLPEFNNEVKNNDYGTAMTLVIDLRKQIEEIWNDEVHSKRRNMIRKSEKLGIEVTKLQENEFDEFYSMYSAAHKRYGIDSQPKVIFEELFYNSKNIGFEVILAKYQGEMQSAVVIAYDKSYATYWLGVSSETMQNMGQGDLLQWEAIKFAKEQGCIYYDLCYIEKEKFPHIYRFKKGFSKNEIELPILRLKPITYKVLNKLSKSI